MIVKIQYVRKFYINYVIQCIILKNKNQKFFFLVEPYIYYKFQENKNTLEGLLRMTETKVHLKTFYYESDNGGKRE